MGHLLLLKYALGIAGAVIAILLGCSMVKGAFKALRKTTRAGGRIVRSLFRKIF